MSIKSISNYFFFLHVVKSKKGTQKNHVRLKRTLSQTAGQFLQLGVDLLPPLRYYSGEVRLVVPEVITLGTASMSSRVFVLIPLHFLVSCPMSSINQEADVLEGPGLSVEAVAVGTTRVIKDDSLK